MTAKFDPNKPHGTITGDESVNPRRFEQNGQHFCGDGSVWTPPEPEPVVDLEALKRQALAEAEQNIDKRIAAAVAQALAAAKK